MKTVKLPTYIKNTNPPQTASTKEIHFETTLICVGANGSGKSAFGAWTEKINSITHRISAQRAISMKEEIAPKPAKTAEANLRRLHETPDFYNLRLYEPQNDFELLLQVLLAEKRQRDAEFVQAHQNADETKRKLITPTPTKMDNLQHIWEEILPHRRLIFGDGRIEAENASDDLNSKKYSARNMSDGERVTFYLIGQCLCAPENSIIIIDEPEIHLHKAIRDPLWNKIEQARPDCIFMYLTHDVDFAASRPGAKLIWIRAFDGTSWDWEELELTNNVPEKVRLELLGSRKPVLFVEGSSESYDVMIYSAVYPELTVTPLGSCETVIQTVQGFATLENLHHYRPKGIIDRDYRCDLEIDRFTKNGIHILGVAEIEHLFCLPGILAQIADVLNFDPTEIISTTKDFVLTALTNERETQIARRAERNIKFLLTSLDLSGAKNRRALLNTFQTKLERIDVEAIYAESEAAIDTIIEEQDYLGALRIFNRKGLARQLKHIFDGACPIALVSRAIQQGNGDAYLRILKENLPSVDELIDNTNEELDEKTTGLSEESCVER